MLLANEQLSVIHTNIFVVGMLVVADSNLQTVRRRLAEDPVEPGLACVATAASAKRTGISWGPGMAVFVKFIRGIACCRGAAVEVSSDKWRGQSTTRIHAWAGVYESTMCVTCRIRPNVMPRSTRSDGNSIHIRAINAGVSCGSYTECVICLVLWNVKQKAELTS